MNKTQTLITTAREMAKDLNRTHLLRMVADDEEIVRARSGQ